MTCCNIYTPWSCVTPGLVAHITIRVFDSAASDQGLYLLLSAGITKGVLMDKAIYHTKTRDSTYMLWYCVQPGLGVHIMIRVVSGTQSQIKSAR